MTINEQRVALGPITGTDWCVLDDPPEHLRAPGGVVLCHAGTLTPHEEAGRAAESAWELLEWQNRRHRDQVDAFAAHLAKDHRASGGHVRRIR